jgi:hypothetical protein
MNFRLAASPQTLRFGRWQLAAAVRRSPVETLRKEFPVLNLKLLTLALLAMWAFSPSMLAQTSARSRSAQPDAVAPVTDLSGVWLRDPGRVSAFEFPRNPAPMTPWGAAKFSTAKNTHGPNPVIDMASNTDPFLKACEPLGVPRVLLANHPFKMVPAKGEMIVLYERSHDFREIYLDGREHPKDLEPSWWGHSIGKWDGDTLVVDTVSLDDRAWLDYQGLPHSDQLHVIERYRRVDHDTLQLDLTIDDPKTYTKSWSVSYIYKLKPWDIGEEICTLSSEKNFDQGIVDPASVAAPAK